MSYKFLDPFNTEAYAEVMKSSGFNVLKIDKTQLYLKKNFLGLFGQIHYPMADLPYLMGCFSNITLNPLSAHPHSPQKLLEIQGLLEPLSEANASYTFTVHVDLSQEDVYDSLSKEKRWGIRKSVDRGAQAYIAKSRDDFENFWDIYSATANRQHIPMRSRSFMEKVFLKQDLTKLFVVEAEDKPIGTYMVLHSHELARFFYGGFLYEYRRFHPNELGHWTVIQHFREQGLKVYDVGGAGKNPQSGDFKVGWGELVKIYRCQFCSSKLLAVALDCYRKIKLWKGKH